jgi:hypothetical protein
MTPDERTTFAGLADVLIPAARGMPAASTVGVHQRRLDRILAARPDLAEPLHAILAKATTRSAETEVARLRDGDLASFRFLLSVATAAYYSSPKVRRLIGYPGQRATELLPDQAEHDLRGGILEPVIARGPIWVDPGSTRRRL